MSVRTRLVALDMDGTVTQHKTHLEPENRRVLDRIAEHCRIVMIGAGSCMRIHSQLDQYPTDVVGCYGLEYAHFDDRAGKLVIDESFAAPAPDRAEMERRAQIIRDRYGFTDYTGDSVEFHASGMMTLAILGTAAKIGDKLAFDPDRSKRRPIYPEVCALFPEYTVFVGGSSSFDIVPKPYNKLYALDRYCAKYGYAKDEVVFMGDDYGPGGNDSQVYDSDYRFITVNDYHDFGRRAELIFTEDDHAQA